MTFDIDDDDDAPVGRVHKLRQLHNPLSVWE